MFKTQVEPQAAGKWFHCQGLNILRHHFMLYKSIDYRKLPFDLCFTITMEKVQAELLRKCARYICLYCSYRQ